MSKTKSKREIVLILPDLRSAQNVGSIFRTADASGVARIYLTGYTPAPVDQFKRINKTLAKTALGAEETVPWVKVARINDLIKRLKSDDFQIIAVEQAENSIDYRKLKIKPNAKLAFVFGNEVTGLAQNILTNCDQTIEIPMRGLKESLNVSVVVGIVLYHYF